MQHPGEEGARLRRAPQREESLEGEGGIARPREAVVPVALATHLLRQRGRRRRGDRTRRGEDEELQCKRTPDDRFAPRPVVLPGGGPVAPGARSLGKPSFNLDPG